MAGHNIFGKSPIVFYIVKGWGPIPGLGANFGQNQNFPRLIFGRGGTKGTLLADLKGGEKWGQEGKSKWVGKSELPSRLRSELSSVERADRGQLSTYTSKYKNTNAKSQLYKFKIHVDPAQLSIVHQRNTKQISTSVWWGLGRNCKPKQKLNKALSWALGNGNGRRWEKDWERKSSLGLRILGACQWGCYCWCWWGRLIQYGSSQFPLQLVRGRIGIDKVV